MALGFKSLVIAMILAGLFTFAMFTFAVNISVSHGSGTILENELVNRTFGHIESNLSEVQSQAETQRTSFLGEIPVIGEASVILQTIVGVTGSMMGIFRAVLSLLGEVLVVTFGLEQTSAEVIVGVFVGILLLSLVLLAWSVYRSGR